MNTEIYGVLTFQSTHHTIQAEEVFKEKEIGYKIIPTPREITLSCGLAIVFDLHDLEDIKDMVENKDINIANVYRYIKSGTGNKAEKLF